MIRRFLSLFEPFILMLLGTVLLASTTVPSSIRMNGSKTARKRAIMRAL